MTQESRTPADHKSGISKVFIRGRHGIVSFVLFFTGIVCFWQRVDSGWCCDDPQILKHAIRHSPFEYFFVPTAWRALIGSSFTPWLSLMYDFDFHLFGFDAAGFHAHQLLSIVILAFLLYLLINKWCEWWIAGMLALLFLLGTPIAVAAQQLMVRHYTEGLMFYLLSLLLVIRALERDSHLFQGLAAVSFLISICAKELYFPLGLVPLVLPIKTFGTRFRFAWPFLFVMIAYLAWRAFMLGEVVGGYTPVGAMGVPDVAMVLAQFGRIPWLWFDEKAVWLAAILCLSSVGLAVVTGQWRRLLLPLITLVLLFSPLIPLGRYPGIGPGSERYLTALWCGAVIGFGWAIRLFARRGLRGLQVFCMAPLILLAAGAWTKTKALQGTLRDSSREQNVQGRALVTSTSHEVIYLTPEVPRWFVSGLIDLRPMMGQLGPPPRHVSDESQLLSISLSQYRVLRYQPHSYVMADITSAVPATIASWKRRLRQVRLSVELDVDVQNRTVAWRLGPYSDGAYWHINASGRVAVPPNGRLRVRNPLGDCFRFRYDAPTGWSAYTPPLSLPTEGSNGVAALNWEGESESPEEVGSKDCTSGVSSGTPDVLAGRNSWHDAAVTDY